MHAVAERVYMDLLVEIGRAGKTRDIYLAWSNSKKKFLLIRDGDYRADLLDTDKYELLGTYNGINTPYYKEIAEDLYAFFQEKTSAEHGCRPELERLAQTG